MHIHSSRPWKTTALGLVLLSLAAVLFSLGCGDHGTVGPPATASLAVHVVFPGAAAAKPSVPAPAAVIDRVRAFAFQVQSDESEILEDQAALDIAPEDTSFALSLTVPPAALYRVRVEALGDGVVLFEGQGFVENVGSGKSQPLTLVLTDAQVPAAPTGLTAETESAVSVRLSWQDNAENETRYRIERRTGGGAFQEIHVLQGSFAGTVTYSDDGLSERTSYDYRVRAEGVAGPSDYSNVATARTGIAAPSGLGVASTGAFSLHVTWVFGPPDPAGGFVLQRRLGSGSWSTVASPGAADRSFDDTDLQPLTAYGYRLRAFETADSSAWSGEVVGSTGDRPPVCSLSETLHDFGPVPLGQALTWEVTLTNTGGGTLAGSVGLSNTGNGFTIARNGGPFSLTADQSITVTVGFQPGAAGPVSAQLTTGAGCSVALTGTGIQPGACSLEPAGLDFGSLAVGQSLDKDLTLTNTGGTAISGTVALSGACPGFSVVAGGGTYDLGAGQSRTITVRFQPVGAGDALCTLVTGESDQACRASLSGAGLEPAQCLVSATALDFGTVRLGASADRSLTIRNTGDLPLDGSVSLDCPGFSILSGAGGYTLAAGESLQVAVRFSPTGAGPAQCSLETGTDCDPVTLTGTGEAPPTCAVDPGSLDFGTRAAGTDSTASFVLGNSGGGTLTGTVALSGCSGFTLVSGGGAYSLGAGQTRTVTVRFAPVEPGDYACTVTTGQDCTVPLSGSATPAPVCSVEPTSIEFGPVFTDGDSLADVTITNDGGGILAGTAALSGCDGFSLVSGAGVFSLASGESHTVTVRFAPPEAGSYACDLDLGTGCGTVPLSGTGELPPTCAVEPAALDFGSVYVEADSLRSFTVTNAGSGTLTGAVSLDCSYFTVVSGGGAFALGPNQSRTVTVQFTPYDLGDFACTVDLGTGCPGVELTGSGTYPPYCELDTYELDFGSPAAGAAVRRSFTISNGGGEVLNGAVSESCPNFSIVSGSGPFALAAGESRTVTVEYKSSTASADTCEIQLGTECGSIPAYTTLPPLCSVSPLNMNFGTINAGQYADRTLTIQNVGGGTLTGTVTENCSEFTLFTELPATYAPASPQASVNYALGPGESMDVTVRFQPKSGGVFTCNIQAGDQCVGLNATGTATQATIYPGTFIDFGPSYSTGYNYTQEVTVTNTGAGTLIGEPVESCPEYSLTDYSYEGPVGPFALGPGQSYTFVIWFTTPSAYGTFNCTVDLGPNCPSIYCTASHSYLGKPEGK